MRTMLEYCGLQARYSTSEASGTMIKALAKTIVTYGDELDEDAFKKNVGKYTVRTILRRAKEIRPGILGLATAIVDAYNDKKKKNILAPDRLYKNNRYKKKRVTLVM